MIQDGFIDIHIHMIPDVDDGAASMRMALSMLELERKEGITTVICTPHYGEFGKAARPREYVDAQFELLKQAAAERVPEMRLLRGNELFFGRDIPRKLEEGKAVTMNGTHYVLVEFEPEERARDIYDDLMFLIQEGYSPILAHTERIFDLCDNTRILKNLSDEGVLFQFNADSLLMERIRPFKKLARYLVDEGLASFMATDAHGDDFRPPYFMPAVEWLYKKYDEVYVNSLIYSNAYRLLLGETDR